MNNINRYCSEFELFKGFLDSLNSIRTRINQELSHSVFDDDSSTTHKLLNLKDIINSAITLCGENMFQDIQIAFRELNNMKGDFQLER